MTSPNLAAAARAFVRAVEATESPMERVYGVAYAHGCEYDGPTYEAELAALKDALEETGTKSLPDYRNIAGELLDAGMPEAAAALERLGGELSEWEDPESPRRQEIQEQIIADIGDAQRSEVDLREGQLAAAEAVLRWERMKNEWRPIEDAPPVGVSILCAYLFDGDWEYHVDRRREDAPWEWEDEDCAHWRLLPEPPEYCDG